MKTTNASQNPIAVRQPQARVFRNAGAFASKRSPLFLRRQLKGIQSFVITRGGEYAFMPSLIALRWLASLSDA
jgi:hypothetical protein